MINRARITKDIRATGIRVVRVKTARQTQRIGIHLLHPTQAELEDAVNVALRDLFPVVFIHDFNTWGFQHGHAFDTRLGHEASVKFQASHS